MLFILLIYHEVSKSPLSDINIIESDSNMLHWELQWLPLYILDQHSPIRFSEKDLFLNINNGHMDVYEGGTQ